MGGGLAHSGWEFSRVSSAANSVARLVIGTAQFGLDYGVANRRGKVRLNEVATILTLARGAGVQTLDTAVAYGDCETRLGEIGVGGWDVITKLPAVPQQCVDIDAWVHGAVNASLRRLRMNRLYGLLLHRADDLLAPGGEQIFRTAAELKKCEVVERIGVSIYDPKQLDHLCDLFPIDLVQAPLNVVDRRLLDSGWMARLARDGVELHVRSVFLQGLLVMPESERPQRFDPWRPLWNDWDAWLMRSGLSAIEGCLRFVLSYPEVSRVVVGVDSEEQLRQLLFAVEGEPVDCPKHFSSQDLDLVDPSRW